MRYNCCSTELKSLALIIGVNSAFLNKSTGNESARDLENTGAPWSRTADQELHLSQHAVPDVWRGGSPGVPILASLTSRNGRNRAGG